MFYPVIFLLCGWQVQATYTGDKFPVCFEQIFIPVTRQEAGVLAAS
ncbi:hypothetical protein HMPREF0454_02160 [Hafnia alvei ATCC 51873]|uniref:Uncharacterized protein n=1 Tax=Hafnia alvei ATCC 51873 TaxID=1002364 RepID=G9Y6C7_HAFAL|nr:hypothetical protein HMPREF0454_02160 [Hafnia alvei ATCC 51873]